MIGRFVTADSVISNVYDPQNLNRYSYVLNNPFGYTDPIAHVAIPQTDGSVFVEEWGLTIAGNGSGSATLSNAGITFGTTLGAFQSGLLPSTAYANGVGLEVGNPVSIAQQQASYGQMTHVPFTKLESLQAFENYVGKVVSGQGAKEFSDRLNQLQDLAIWGYPAERELANAELMSTLWTFGDLCSWSCKSVN